MPSAILSLLLIASAATSPPVVLARHRVVRPGVDAFPQIASPSGEPQRRINRALDRLDRQVRTAARTCVAAAGDHDGSWERHVETPMRGPEFVSYVVTDDVDCGGAYPNDGHSAIVYDLASGAPVDWRKLLPSALAGRLELAKGPDGVRMVTLASPRLYALYRAGYDLGPPYNADEQDCRDEVAGMEHGEPVPMFAWLDAKQGGLALQFDFNHANQSCSEPVVVPTAVLRREGASPRLLNALAAAHAAWHARR